MPREWAWLVIDTPSWQAEHRTMSGVGYLVVYTGAFVVYGLMEVLGLMPQEIKSAGVTLSGILGPLYGDLVSNVCMVDVVIIFALVEPKLHNVSSKTHSNYGIGSHISAFALLHWIIICGSNLFCGEILQIAH
jgi:hypothetical protein